MILSPIAYHLSNSSSLFSHYIFDEAPWATTATHATITIYPTTPVLFHLGNFDMQTLHDTLPPYIHGLDATSIHITEMEQLVWLQSLIPSITHLYNQYGLLTLSISIPRPTTWHDGNTFYDCISPSFPPTQWDVSAGTIIPSFFGDATESPCWVCLAFW